MTIDNKVNSLVKIFLLSKIVGEESPIITYWDKLEEFYEKLERKNPEIKSLTTSIEGWVYDKLNDDLEEGLIDKYLNSEEIIQLRNELKPIVLDEINKSAMKQINGISENNNIKKFGEFNIINESKIDLYTVDINELLRSREGFDIFIKLVMDEGMSVTQPITHGYNIEADGNHLDLLNHWRDTYGLEYNVEKVTNKEHPNYGKWFYSINLFRDPTKFLDISNWMKQINQ